MNILTGAVDLGQLKQQTTFRAVATTEALFDCQTTAEATSVAAVVTATAACWK